MRQRAGSKNVVNETMRGPFFELRLPDRGLRRPSDQARSARFRRPQKVSWIDEEGDLRSCS